ncbi:MAG TPA: hypothetical protein VK619_11165, partial [Pyrinomonadaceae bacterium]|nr:hypothetical protein [Pyrinomonadaceae bacterium]
MPPFRFKRLFVSLLLAAFCALTFTLPAHAQQTQPAQGQQQQRRESSVNMNAQIYLIVGTNEQAVDERM